MLFGKWILRGDRLNEYVSKWEGCGLSKREIAERLIRYQTEAAQWESEYPQLLVEARRTFRREGLVPTTAAEWEDLYQKLEPSSYFRDLVHPTWPQISARRAMAYLAVGMEILDETESAVRFARN